MEKFAKTPLPLYELKKACEGLSLSDKLALRSFLDQLVVQEQGTNPGKSAEQRRSTRFALAIPGSGLFLRDSLSNLQKRFSVVILDVSREGVCFKSRQQINRAEVCLLHFRLQRLGYKKIYVEILRIKERTRGGDREYEYGAKAVDYSKVEFMLVTMNRSLKIDQQLAQKGSFSIVALWDKACRPLLVELQSDGYHIDEVQNADVLQTELASTNAHLAIIDERLLTRDLPPLLTTLKKMRQELLVILIAADPNKEMLQLPGVYSVVPRSVTSIEFLGVVQRALRFICASSWQLHAQTKLRFLYFSQDDSFANACEACLRHIRYNCLIERSTEDFSRYVKNQQGQIQVDFVFLDVQHFSRADFAAISQLVEQLAIPVIAMDSNEHRQKIALMSGCDGFLDCNAQSDLIEAALLQAFRNKTWKNR